MFIKTLFPPTYKSTLSRSRLQLQQLIERRAGLTGILNMPLPFHTYQLVSLEKYTDAEKETNTHPILFCLVCLFFGQLLKKMSKILLLCLSPVLQDKSEIATVEGPRYKKLFYHGFKFL